MLGRGRVGGGQELVSFFSKTPNLKNEKKFFLFLGGVGGGGARGSEFFYLSIHI